MTPPSPQSEAPSQQQVGGPVFHELSTWHVQKSRSALAAMEPVGVTDIAERMKVTRDAVNQWRRRGLGFPRGSVDGRGRPARN